MGFINQPITGGHYLLVLCIFHLQEQIRTFGETVARLRGGGLTSRCAGLLRLMITSTSAFAQDSCGAFQRILLAAPHAAWYTAVGDRSHVELRI